MPVRKSLAISRIISTIRSVRSAATPRTGAVPLCDVAQTPVDLHGGIVLPIRAERGHFAARQRLWNTVCARIHVFRAPAPSGFAIPEFDQIRPVLAGPAALRRRAGSVGLCLCRGRMVQAAACGRIARLRPWAAGLAGGAGVGCGAGVGGGVGAGSSFSVLLELLFELLFELFLSEESDLFESVLSESDLFESDLFESFLPESFLPSSVLPESPLSPLLLPLPLLSDLSDLSVSSVVFSGPTAMTLSMAIFVVFSPVSVFAFLHAHHVGDGVRLLGFALFLPSAVP